MGDDFLTDGAQTVTVTVKGTGTLYYSTYLRYFSLEEDLKGGGNEIFVKRRYFKLTPRLVTKGEKGRHLAGADLRPGGTAPRRAPDEWRSGRGGAGPGREERL